MIRYVKIIPFVIVLLVSYGCGMLGPASLKEGRNRYNQVVAYTGSEQMLINLVKLCYRDSPTFLQVSVEVGVRPTQLTKRHPEFQKLRPDYDLFQNLQDLHEC